jgi:hypothetical protein
MFGSCLAGLIFFAALVGITLFARADDPQALTAAEYFWDADPGAGNGTPVSIPAGETLITSDIPPLNVDVTHLSAGLHLLGVRVKDATGRWSGVALEPIQVQDANTLIAAVNSLPTADTNKLLASGEYFFDTDPGLGNGTKITIPTGETLITPDIPPLNLNISQLALGLHQAGFRVQDIGGRWSSVTWEPILVEDASALIAGVTNFSTGDTNKFLIAGEYFWDTDPGLGHGTATSVPPDEIWTAGITNPVNALIPVLPGGIHQLGVRTKDTSGNWSAAQWLPMEVLDPPVITNEPASQIVSAGSNFSLTVGAGGAMPFFFQWFQNSNSLAGATNQTLTIAAADFTNAGAYYVAITNIFGVATSLTANVTVTVGSPIATAVLGGGTISASPSLSDYLIGQAVTLTANAGRYYTFVRWSDGNTNVSRNITIGTSNFFTADFTNSEPLETQTFKRWEDDFGGPGFEEVRSQVATSDGGYLLAGTSTSGVSGNKTTAGFGGEDFWIVKIDSHGNKQWEQTYGGSGDEYLNAAIVTADGGYLLGGSTTSDISGDKTTTSYGGGDGWLVKVDSAGNKQWDQTYGGSGVDYFLALHQTPDGGYAVTGASGSAPSGNKTSPNYGGQDAWVLKLDAAGNKQWEQSYGGDQDDYCLQILQTPDGGFLLGAGSRSGADGNKTAPGLGPPGSDAGWIIKIDASGNKQWDKTYGGSGGDDYFSTVRATPEGGYIVSGILNYNSGSYWLLKLDSSGSIQWQKTYHGGAQDLLQSVLPVPDGGYILGGASSSGIAGDKSAPNLGGSDYWFLKVDSLGNKICDTTYGGSSDDYAITMTVDGQQNVLLSGWSLSGVSGNKTTVNFGDHDMWAVAVSVRTAPVGTPVVLVNGLYDPSNNFSLAATNTIQVTLQSTYPNGFIFYTLDGSDPDFTANPYTVGEPFLVTNSLLVRAIAYNDDGSLFQEADPVAIQVVPVYNLTNTTPGGGSVAFDPPGGIYLSNAAVTATATASNGWTFLRWQGASSSTANPVTVTMNSSTNLMAVFGTTISPTPPSGGSIALAPAQGPYPYGSTVRLIAIPASGKAFSRWFSFTGPSNNPLDFLVISNTPVVNALFGNLAANNFTLTTLLNGSGTVTKNPFAESYLNNSVVQLTAVPDSGNTFTGWSGDAGGAQNPLSVTMNSTKVITATFAANATLSGQPPIVAITNLAPEFIFTAPTNILINATASDANLNGYITQVAFFAGTNALGVASNAPYSFVWTNAPVGTNILTCVAADNFGLVATSAPVTVTVQTALPQIGLISPNNGDSFITPANILIHALASDADNSIARVELYNGSTLLGSITNPPYQLTWSNVPIGAYTLTARAIDSFGPIVTSAPVSFSVIAPPSTNPAVFQFSAANYSVNESNASVTLTVLNTGNFGGLINYLTHDVSAHGGSGFSGDYTTVQGSLTFSNNQSSANIVVPILDNFLTRADIQFQVQLLFPSQGSSLGSPSTATVTIHENDTGGASNSLLSIAFPSAQPPTGSALQVTLLPPEAGGQWRFAWDVGWRNSGDTVANLAADNYPIQFRNVSNYLAIPSSVTISVPNNTTARYTNQYYPTIGQPSPSDTGSLTVKISPNAPTGAGWRIFGETAWRAPGSTASNLLVDIYPIEFAPVSGWSKPVSEAIQLVGGQGTSITVNYLLASSPPAGFGGPIAVTSDSLSNSSLYPFQFDGQLQTDVGYGSGAVVRPNIVLTAAHLVFDDQTLAFAKNAWWYFQEEAGAFQPKPIQARGWFMLSGYAAQRTNDLVNGGLSVDQSSPQSRELDVAAMYFLTLAGRAGYGGYLSSDAMPNPYLTSSAAKMVAGYPVDGSEFGQVVQPGLLYVAPPQPSSSTFTPDYQDTYTASWFLDYPGASGAPVYVQFSTPSGPYFYPAGIYLGTLGSGASSVSVVRAIKSDVVNLINLAASEGDAGTNNSGGGVITFVAPGISADNRAFVQVALDPPAAVSAGAAWQLQGDTAFGVNGLKGIYTRAITSTNFAVVFKPVAGWNFPITVQTNISLGPPEIITLTANYTLLAVLSADPVRGIGIIGEPGTSFRIEYRTNLTTGQWLPLQTNLLSAGFNQLFPWPPTNGPAAFYRAVQLSP